MNAPMPKPTPPPPPYPDAETVARLRELADTIEQGELDVAAFSTTHGSVQQGQGANGWERRLPVMVIQLICQEPRYDVITPRSKEQLVNERSSARWPRRCLVTSKSPAGKTSIC